MKPVTVFLVAGARPNFIKIAALYRAFCRSTRFAVELVHTGQHYDEALSTAFFRDLALPDPDITLDVGSGSHGAQTARVLERFEAVLLARRPDLVVVVGDVNSTLAASLATVKTVYPSGRRPLLAHVEAGLRSFDREMPEEINRTLTDTISDFLFTSERSAEANLQREGIPRERIHFVGNVMIDTLLSQRERALAIRAWERFNTAPGTYAVVTLHRPSNVDGDGLMSLMKTLEAVAERVPVVFPVHPRTQARIDGAGAGVLRAAACLSLHLTAPLGYLEFLSLMTGARVVLTDSGGIQEETTVLGVPCLTLRANTERPVTVTEGTNRLVGTDRCAVLAALDSVLTGTRCPSSVPELWDGHAADRVVRVLEDCLPSRIAGAER